MLKNLLSRFTFSLLYSSSSHWWTRLSKSCLFLLLAIAWTGLRVSLYSWTLGSSAFAFSIFRSSGACDAAAPRESCASFHLLDTLGIVLRDFVGVFCVTVDRGVNVIICSAIMLAMSSYKPFCSYTILAVLLMAFLIAASISFCFFVVNSSSIRIFSFPLLLGVTNGGSSSFSSSISSSLSSFSLFSLSFSASISSSYCSSFESFSASSSSISFIYSTASFSAGAISATF